METVEIDSIAFSDRDVDAYISETDIVKQLGAYAICGIDHQGKSIFWIKVHEILPPEETADVHWLAIHADDKSLREGITFSDSCI